jgi:hypothetical protein
MNAPVQSMCRNRTAPSRTPNTKGLLVSGTTSAMHRSLLEPVASLAGPRTNGIIEFEAGLEFKLKPSTYHTLGPSSISSFEVSALRDIASCCVTGAAAYNGVVK